MRQSVVVVSDMTLATRPRLSEVDGWARRNVESFGLKGK
jgi:hypothetical protein